MSDDINMYSPEGDEPSYTTPSGKPVRTKKTKEPTWLDRPLEPGRVLFMASDGSVHSARGSVVQFSVRTASETFLLDLHGPTTMSAPSTKVGPTKERQQ
jgi:hypothetical protein